MSPPSVKALIVDRALQLGFDLCRVTHAKPPGSAPRFLEWLGSGAHADMQYLVRTATERSDLRRVLPGVRSVILLGTDYFSRSTPAGTSRPGHGRVARYACFTDYHAVVRAWLDELAGFVADLGGPGAGVRSCVDTAPVLERDLAQRAGLGFIGKHTNLVGRPWGNWLLLAEILTTLELPPDAPERNRCGSCRRCLDACPTGAIVAPFRLDARRCLSYLTIENRGPIPVEFRPALGPRLFGCDDCLEVCPWNRWARECRSMHAHLRPQLASLDSAALLALDPPGFRQAFGATPLARAKLRGLRRNACVVLGNTGVPEQLGALRRVAEDPDPMLAEHARWAIGQVERRAQGPQPATPSAGG